MFKFPMQDEMITQEEWKMMWGDCLKDIVNDKFPDWQTAYMELMFDVNDKSGKAFDVKNKPVKSFDVQNK